MNFKIMIMNVFKVLFIVSALLFVSCSKSEKEGTYEIKHGEFKASIIESGELLAVNAVSVNMPAIGYKYGWNFKIIDLVDNGTIVKKGDNIAKIDQASIRKKIIDMETKYDLELATLSKLKIEQDIQAKNLETKLEEEQASFELKQLEVETFKFESPQKRKIKELEFEQVEINRQKALKDIERQKIVKKNQIKIQTIKVNQIKLDVEEAKIAIMKLNIVSPLNGIVQLKRNRRTKINYKIGDEIYLGQSFAIVPDISLMKVKTFINEMDYKKIKIGQKVDVRLDALPEVVFKGRLSSLGKLSKPKERDSRIKVFDAEVTMIDNDERLKPGMTVGCNIYYADFANATYVSNECLLNKDGKYYVFTSSKDSMEVKVLHSNNINSLLLGDYDGGEKLIKLSNKKNS